MSALELKDEFQDLGDLHHPHVISPLLRRGIGDSDDSYTGNYTIRSYAQSTVSLFDALELEQPDVLGWALGGFIAMALAVEYPDAINRVVVADATLGGAALLVIRLPLVLSQTVLTLASQAAH